MPDPPDSTRAFMPDKVPGYGCHLRSKGPSPAQTRTGRYDLRVDSLGIDGSWLFTPQVHRDERGSFLEAFRGTEFAADLGYSLEVAQVNCSVSRRGVIRASTTPTFRPARPGT